LQAPLVAQSIGQAFHVAYIEYLKANGIESPSHHPSDVNYQEVLSQQEIFGEELNLFANKDMQKEVVVLLIFFELILNWLVKYSVILYIELLNIL
jgi:hypothetical protein